jgi:oligo-1,6-glucosidase
VRHTLQYYGDEIGMTNIDMPNIAEYPDVDAKGKYKATLASGKVLNEFMKVLNYSSRENGRTPMQWDQTENAGFTTSTPWKRINDNSNEIHLAAQNDEPNSILNHFRKMTKVRKDDSFLVYGKCEILQREYPNIYAFTITLDEENILVLLNFSQETSFISLPEISNSDNTIINNYSELEIENNKINLLSYQAVILRIK